MSHSTKDLKTATLFDVSHVTAVVTGGGSGIGLMIAQALHDNGAKVYITGRRQDLLEAVVDKYSTGPGQIIALPGDISVKDEVLRLAREVGAKEPAGIQLLVNNAAILHDDLTLYDGRNLDHSSADAMSEWLLRSDPGVWEDTFRTNVTGQFWMSAAFVPLLSKGRAATPPGCTSQIVNVSSISGLTKHSSWGRFAYASSKAALVHLTAQLASELSQTGIRVNQIAPGGFPSEMTVEVSEQAMSKNPSGRPGIAGDMAATILFLVGRGGTFYNNQILYPDGGAMIDGRFSSLYER